MTAVSLRARKKAGTRERILTAACELFAKRGIAAVTVDVIAAAADVGKGTVYNYFSAKEDIVVAFLIELDRDALETMALLPGDGMNVADSLDAAAWSLLEHKAPYREFVRAFFARSFAPDNFAHEIQEFQAALDESLGALFDRLSCEAAGAAPSMSRDDFVMSFKTMQFGISAIWTFEGPPFATARALCRRHMALLAQGLEP
jgi:AcrR family transcriptional regulator